MAKHSTETRKFALDLFVQGNCTAKEIAARLSVNEKTIARWRSDEDWDKLRSSFTLTKPKQLEMMYAQINQLNENISERDAKLRFATSREADSILKLTMAIKNLESELSLRDKIDVMIDFSAWVKKVDHADSKRCIDLFNSYIRSHL